VLVTEAGRSTAYTYDSAGNMLTRTVTDTATSVSRTTTWTYNTQGRLLTETPPGGVTERTYAYYSNTAGFVDTVAADPSFGNVGLLLHMDGANNSTSFTDGSTAHRAVTANGTAKISTAQSRFGGGSVYFDGTANGYLSMAYNAAFSPGAGDYTAELYARPIGAMTAQGRDLLGQSDSGGGYVPFAFRYESSGVWNLIIYNGAAYQSVAGGPVALNQWVHLAMVKTGSTITFFVDGINKGSLTIGNGGLLYASSQPMTIGRLGSYNGNYFIGYVDDVRFTKGVARYTANFTPRAQAFPNADTMLIDPNATGHTMGDLQSITNAAGHATQFTLYDRAGRVRQMVDPNGVATDTAYTPRGWVRSVKITAPGGAARTTTYTYDNAGQLTGATLPDGSTLGYSYDAAHRLTGVTDAKGNTVTYTLDGMGNQVGEQVKDPSGNLQRNITRVYDALNRVQQVTGASN
jgi:YD repeat-containing protein